MVFVAITLRCGTKVDIKDTQQMTMTMFQENFIYESRQLRAVVCQPQLLSVVLNLDSN